MDELSTVQRARLQEVADLLLEIYRTLVRMRYLRSEWIHEGPHNIDTLLPLYSSLDLDPSIIYLYRILPYVDTLGVEGVDFFHGSYFADFRKERQVERGRNPFHSDEERDFMRPWMTPLSLLGNHRSVIIYSSRDHCIWILDQESTGSTDPGLSEGARRAERGGVDEEDEEEEEEDGEDGDEGEDEDEGDEEDDEESEDDEEDEEEEEEEEDDDDDEGMYEPTDGRPAGDVLRDIVRWYKELRETPSGGELTGGGWSKELVRPLYRKHSWPDMRFDGDAFQVDRVRADASNSVDHEVGGMLERIFTFKAHIADSSAKRQAQFNLAEGSTVDEKWLADWKLRAEVRHLAGVVDEFEDELNSLCPNGLCQWFDELPLFQAKELQESSARKETDFERLRLEVQEAERSRLEVTPATRSKLSYLEEQAMIYRTAFINAKADIEHSHPGKDFQSIIRAEHLKASDPFVQLRSLNRSVDFDHREIAASQIWISQLPGGTDQAKKSAENWIEQLQRQVARNSEEIQATKASITEAGHNPQYPKHMFQVCQRCQDVFKQKGEEWKLATTP